MDDRLKQAIIKTLCYFDIFDFPLTKEELHRWLYIDYIDLKQDYTDFLIGLDTLKSDNFFENKNSYYFLPGKVKNIEKREHGVRLVEEKMKMAKRGIKKIRYVPFVKAVFVCNTLASSLVSEDSDIDVFIVTRKNRLWLSRFLVTLILSLFRLRRTKKKIKNKICLSFYVSEDALDLSSVRIKSPDIYLAYWIDQLIPVYDPNSLLKEFFKNNSWVKKYLPHALKNYKLLERWRVDDNKISKFVKKILEKMWGAGYGDMIEAQARGAQRAKMKTNYMSVQNEKDTRVVINDKMLKFHENDRREEYKKRWLERVQSFSS